MLLSKIYKDLYILDKRVAWLKCWKLWNVKMFKMLTVYRRKSFANVKESHITLLNCLDFWWSAKIRRRILRFDFIPRLNFCVNNKADEKIRLFCWLFAFYTIKFKAKLSVSLTLWRYSLSQKHWRGAALHCLLRIC